MNYDISYYYLGDIMKYFVKLVRNICLGLFGIYSVNVLFSSINIMNQFYYKKPF